MRLRLRPCSICRNVGPEDRPACCSGSSRLRRHPDCRWAALAHRRCMHEAARAGRSPRIEHPDTRIAGTSRNGPGRYRASEARTAGRILEFCSPDNIPRWRLSYMCRPHRFSCRWFQRDPVKDSRPTLADAGIDSRLSSRARKLAAVPRGALRWHARRTDRNLRSAILQCIVDDA